MASDYEDRVFLFMRTKLNHSNNTGTANFIFLENIVVLDACKNIVEPERSSLIDAYVTCTSHLR